MRWITREEAEGLIAAAKTLSQKKSSYLSDIIIVALHTGMRRGEMLGLEWSRVDFHAGLIHLEASHTKTATRRSVPINATAREALLSRARYRSTHCPDARHVFCGQDCTPIVDPKEGFSSACRKAGIENFRFHDLRHTCAAWLVSAGVPIYDVRDVLGHSTVSMTERYAHLAPERARSAVAVLDVGHDSVTPVFQAHSKGAKLTA
ncbi:single-strand DNA-binding protein [Gammaproteobacteria bacterium]